MYYLVTVGYELEQLDRNGDPRLQKIKYVIESESVEEATMVVARYRSEDVRSSQSLSIVKLQIDSVIDKQNSPKYYK